MTWLRMSEMCYTYEALFSCISEQAQGRQWPASQQQPRDPRRHFSYDVVLLHKFLEMAAIWCAYMPIIVATSHSRWPSLSMQSPERGRHCAPTHHVRSLVGVPKQHA
jgi:hypothetical protein